MKKNYVMLALASMMMAACANNDLVDEGVVKEEVPQAIEFEPFANKTSRAEIVDASSLKTPNGGFHVWGYKSSDSWTTKFTVFNGAEVLWNNNWDYSESSAPQYWDKTSKYKFYAVAPKAPTDVEYSIDNSQKITIEGVQSPINATSMDYLIVRPENVDEIDGSIKAPVSLTFTHIMSKISFKLKAGINEKIVVTSLSMYGWDNGTATFTQNQNATSEWEFTTNSVVSKGSAISILSTATELPYVKNAASQTATSTTVGNSFIMVPQTIQYIAPAAAVGETPAVLESGLTFIVSYKIVRGEGDTLVEEVFTDQVGILKTNQTWSTNTHTTYTIIVGPDAIEFGDPTINPWTLGNADGNLSF